MAALKYFIENAQPVRNFITMLNGGNVRAERPDLKASAYLNSFGTKSVRLATRPVTVQVVPPSIPTEKIASAQVPEAVAPAIPAAETIELPIATRMKALEFQRRQQLLLTAANRLLPPGCQVMAWSIVPLELFQGALGRLLTIACDFHCYGPENTMLLPTTAAGAQHLGLPQHPLVVSQEHLKIATMQISVLRDRIAAEHRRATMAAQNGDLSQVFGRTDSKQRYCKDLSYILENITKTQFENSTVQKHHAHFGALIPAM